MAKLWEKGYELNKDMERFTVGEDYLLDRALIKVDAIGNLAHARTLERVGILSKKEVESLKAVLIKILEDEKFTISVE